MEVSPEELHDLMQRPGPRAFELVDVRDGSEFVVSRLHWAELIPLDRLATEAPKRFPENDKPIVVYCRDGQDSQRAATLLNELGYEFVFHLTGGLRAWKKEIDPSLMLTDDQPATSANPAMPPLNRPAASSSGSSSSFREISPEDLREIMARPGPREFRLIDVREEDEFQICRLDWAELIPLSQLSEQAPRRLVDKDRPLVVYCHHGMRSQHACEWLRRAGYDHVYNLTGGIEAWAERVEPDMRRY
jgi:rhodanese-related sulfurtransferase